MTSKQKEIEELEETKRKAEKLEPKSPAEVVARDFVIGMCDMKIFILKRRGGPILWGGDEKWMGDSNEVKEH